MDDGTIEAEFTVEPTPSFHPWPAPNDEGGGIVLPCIYIVCHPDIQTQFDKLTTILDIIPEGTAMTLNLL